MRYTEFRESVRSYLRRNPSGATWTELRDALKLPYERACPEWTKRMEKEIGLVRSKGAARALIWRIKNSY
jgi:hypothetical protein